LLVQITIGNHCRGGGWGGESDRLGEFTRGWKEVFKAIGLEVEGGGGGKRDVKKKGPASNLPFEETVFF